MQLSKRFFRSRLSLDDWMGVSKYRREFRDSHPNYFDPTGLVVFCGAQGQGKSYSACEFVLPLLKKYPKCILVTGMQLSGMFDEYKDRIFEYEGAVSLFEYSNGYEGVIFLIDEIQLEYNSLESKGIGPEIFSEISQMRKQRTLIVGTSQVFQRIAKPFREQIGVIVSCRCLFGRLQINRVLDGTTVKEKNGQVYATTSKTYYRTHRPEMYDSFDTYQKFKRLNKAWKEVA